MIEIPDLTHDVPMAVRERPPVAPIFESNRERFVIIEHPGPSTDLAPFTFTPLILPWLIVNFPIAESFSKVSPVPLITALVELMHVM
jgi:hypothetical protein